PRAPRGGRCHRAGSRPRWWGLLPAAVSHHDGARSPHGGPRAESLFSTRRRMSSTPTGGETEKVYAVELRGITKRFPGVVANHDIDISVAPGTVHAIVGENGAGKSTLMKTLYGMHRPD